ncbi:MAG: TIR domain-containing protein [Clostridia bacterium]|nr:TIR domain-containing protein [Clostridia bacterium]
MKKCKVSPYRGESDYIYISHSSQDKRYVYPVIEQLTKDGYRVWFDEGVRFGPEATNEIAEKISRCRVFLAYITENTVDSYQFKRELNFAVINKKDIIALMHEDVCFSLGMEMQMTALHTILKYKVENDAFFKSLYSFEAMSTCLGEPNDSVIVSDEDEYRETLADLFGADERRSPPIDDALFIKIQSEQESDQVVKAVLVKLTTNEEISITTPKMIIGRVISDKSKPIVDYSIETNSMISRIHAVVLFKNKEYYLVDCGSVNKSYLNGDELQINEERLLHDGDIIKLANEKFRFRIL